MEKDNLKLNKMHVEHKLKDGTKMSLRHNVETGKLRNMLREKCRIRIKESRAKNFNNSRNFLTEQKSWLEEIIRDELKEIDENMSLEDIIYNELIEESYQWLIEQFELELNYYAETDRAAPVTMCPICQKFELKLDDGIIRCNCGLSLKYNSSLQCLSNRIHFAVTQHSNTCNKPLTFFQEPNVKNEISLNAYCENCDYFLSLI